jgi:uncharacterized protein (TIGR02231 family)
MTSSTAVQAPVSQVTLLEDRARVIRRGSLRLSKGSNVFVVEDVSPVIVDKTTVARLLGGEGAQVTDVQVRRRAIHVRPTAEEEPAEGSYEALNVELDGIVAELQKIRDQRAVLRRQLKLNSEIAILTLDDWAEDASWSRPVPDKAGESLDAMAAEERKTCREITDLSLQLRDLHVRREHLELRIQTMRNPSRREWAGVEVVVEASRDGEAKFEVEYMVPGACWRPYHCATLEDGDAGESVSFSSDACVWQNTGEDWNDVELIFSTERASLGTEPPDLDNDVLGVQKRSAQVVVEAREQEVQTTGLGSEDRKMSDELPGIDDGGEEVHLRPSGSSTVPSDGRPHRVRLLDFSSNASTELVSMPELAPHVLLRSRLSNDSEHALLAGPVDLIRNSGLVGRTSILYVAPGERFELGWGPEADVRIKRSVDSFREKSRMLSSWVSRSNKVELSLSNLGEQPRVVHITERIAVSEIDKVKIEVDPAQSSDGVTADGEGFVHWQVRLEPLSQASRRLFYTIRKHEDVVGI